MGHPFRWVCLKEEAEQLSLFGQAMYLYPKGTLIAPWLFVGCYWLPLGLGGPIGGGGDDRIDARSRLQGGSLRA